MKKLILLLLITFSFSAGHQNPNGRPFSLNVKLDYFNHEKKQVYDYDGPNDDNWFSTRDREQFIVTFTLPVSEYLTLSTRLNNGINGSFYAAGVGEPAGNNLFDMYSLQEKSYFSAELHLPLYKLWEKQ
jgi:hypothetical protein